MLRYTGHRILLGCLILAALLALFTLFPYSGDTTPSLDRSDVLKGDPTRGVPARGALDRTSSEEGELDFNEDRPEKSGSDENDARSCLSTWAASGRRFLVAILCTGHFSAMGTKCAFHTLSVCAQRRRLSISSR